jgi:hypothetical protein
LRARAAGAKFKDIANALNVTHQTVRIIHAGSHTYMDWDGTERLVVTHPSKPPILHWMGMPA